MHRMDKVNNSLVISTAGKNLLGREQGAARESRFLGGCAASE